MGGRYIFDIETNGFVETMDRVHSLVFQDIDTDEVFSCDNHKAYHNIEDGLKRLMEADMLIGHNIVLFDIPAIQKIYPWFTPKATLRDTLLMGRMAWPELMSTDEKLVNSGRLPRKLRGRYSLESFGCRMGLWKGDYSEEMKKRGLDPWANWSQEMQDYCIQDVAVNRALWNKLIIRTKDFSEESFDLENSVQVIIDRQKKYGFAFDVKKAQVLYTDLLDRQSELHQQLQQTFEPWWAMDKVVTVRTTRNTKLTEEPWIPIGHKVISKGKPTERTEELYNLCLFSEGSTHSKVKRVEFNPGSRDHIAQRLKLLFNWKPTEFGKDGKPTVDDEILGQLPWPEAKLIAEYLMVGKRLGAVGEGKQAWLKKEKDGRIHGNVMTLGACTARMTHSGPNVAQTPANDVPYGARCRELFCASPGHVLVGCDADALELRLLAGYMALYDGGEYIKTVLEGDKSKGTDMHSVNARAIGLDPVKLYEFDGKQVTGRDTAKTWFYAFIYGAGDWKLGNTLGQRGSKDTVLKIGKQSRASFLSGLPALGKITTQVKARAKTRGYVKGIDGRNIYVRHLHASLNTLLQGAGAIIMKKALVILDDALQVAGLVPGVDYEFVANVHDEWQIETLPKHVELISLTASQSIKLAGEAYDFKCPLAGNSVSGNNWKETH